MRTPSPAVSRETSGRVALPAKGRLLLPLMLVGAVLLVACGSIASPQGWAGPTAAGELLLASLDKGELTALDLDTQERLWTFPDEMGEGDECVRGEDDDLDPEAIYGNPVVSSDRVYLGAYDGAVYSLEAKSGTICWRALTGGPILGGPALADGTIYVGSNDGNVYALDADTGAPLWTQPFEAGDEVWARPVVEGDTVYVATMAGELFALDAATGEARWSFEADGALPSAPALAEGRLYVGALDNSLYALDAGDGSLVWEFAAGNWFWTTPLVQDDIVYAAALDSKVYALDAAGGELRWSRPFETAGTVRATPALVGGVLVVADRDGNVYGLDADTGVEVWPFRTLDSGVFANPLVMEESIFISTRNGDLVDLDPSNGSFRNLFVTQ